MNILHIIGNGFDLNLGLKTSYKDFYDYYSGIESDIEGVDKLKRAISKNYLNWSDLELALGEYTEVFNTVQEFDQVFEDLGDHLAKYLSNEEKNFLIDKIDMGEFFRDLVKPEDLMPQRDKEKIKRYKHNFVSGTWHVDVFTLNYTRVIDKIIGEKSNINLGHHLNNSGSVIFRGVEHIHGYVDDRMVLGVNDITQLKNKEFHNEIDVLEAIIKEKCNKAYRHTIDTQFEAKIKRANLISIFGASIGDSDNMWWGLIGHKLINDIPIIIFTKEEVVAKRIGYKQNRAERRLREHFLSKTSLTDEQKEQFGHNLYIVLNAPMFNRMKKIK